MPYNSTIKTRKKICKRCSQPKYIFSRGRCADCARIEDFKPIDKHSDNELSGLIDDCDALVSLYVRFKDSDKEGQNTCYTCGARKHWKELQAGHYIGRSCMYLRFDLRNLRPQCEYCNCHKHGNILVFGKKLDEEYNGITEILYEESKMVYKYSREELKALIVEMNLKLKELHQKKSL